MRRTLSHKNVKGIKLKGWKVHGLPKENLAKGKQPTGLNMSLSVFLLANVMFWPAVVLQFQKEVSRSMTMNHPNPPSS